MKRGARSEELVVPTLGAPPNLLLRSELCVLSLGRVFDRDLGGLDLFGAAGTPGIEVHSKVRASFLEVRREHLVGRHNRLFDLAYQ